MADDDRSLAAYFIAATKHDPDRIFLRSPTTTITCAEAVVRVATGIEALRALGLKKGDRIAAYAEDIAENLFLSLTAASLGVEIAPLSPLFSVAYFIDGIVNRLSPRAVFTTSAHVTAFLEQGVRPLVYGAPRAGVDALPIPGAGTVDARSFSQACEDVERASAAVKADDIYMIQPTSGSTGQPKLVVRRHVALSRYARFVGDQLGDLAPDGRPHDFLCVASLTHAFGNHMLATAFRLGASLCTTTRIDTATELSEIRSLDPSVIPILPRVQRSVFLQRSAQGPKLPSERVFGPRAAFLCTAGCKPNYDVLRYVSAGVQIIEFYGSTEASVVAVTPRGEWREGSAGVLASDVEARVSADGELEVRSPGVTPGYIGAESAFTPDGYFMTGDAAEIDGDRRLRIVGRKRDVFNTPEGSNIYPARIEEMLEMLPWVDQAFLFGDARPFLTALIVMRDRDGWTSARDDGFLELANAGPAYREAGSWLAGINNRLERVEQIVRFGLLAREFPLDVYATVTAGKVRRDRAAALRVYGSVLDHLYSSDVHPVPDDSFVPGADRRMRLRGK